MEPHQAAAEAARRRVKRADGLLRQAVRDLAAIADGQTALGTVRVHDRETADAARELIALGVGRHGAVDVIVIARPTGRQAGNPPRPHSRGEGDNSNGTTRSDQEHASA